MSYKEGLSSALSKTKDSKKPGAKLKRAFSKNDNDADDHKTTSRKTSKRFGYD